MPFLIVERSFAHPMSESEVDHLFTLLEPCLNQHDVEWMHSYLSHDRTRMFCVFAASGVEPVRMAHRSAGISHGAVWPADRLPGDHDG